MNNISKIQINSEDVIKIAEQIVEFLSNNPGDFTGAAKLVKIPREKLLELLDKFPGLFADIEDAYFDKLNSLCRLDAMGRNLPGEFDNFDFEKAKTLLTWRQKEIMQINRDRRKAEANKVIEISNYDASKAIREHLAKQNLITLTENQNGQTKDPEITADINDIVTTGTTTDDDCSDE